MYSALQIDLRCVSLVQPSGEVCESDLSLLWRDDAEAIEEKIYDHGREGMHVFPLCP